MSEKFPEKVLSVAPDGLHIISDSITSKLEKKSLSPSLITGLAKCPASWLADTFVIRDLIPQEVDNPAQRGTLFHKVMEDFFALPQEERTRERLSAVVGDTLALEDFQAIAQVPEAMDWLENTIAGYYEMGGQPEKIRIATINDGKKDRVGLEMFTKGRLGNTSREILGLIDRVTENPKNGAVVIEDWKTAAKAKRWNPRTKGDEGLPEARQQTIYAMLLSQKGVNVCGARLIFPAAREVVNVNINDKAFADRVIADIEDADMKLDIMTERNTFEYTPNFLCAWCPLAKICPAATIKPYRKMQDAYGRQPEVFELSPAFEIA